MREHQLYETEREAMEAIKNDKSFEPLVVIPDTNEDGDIGYKIGTYDEYREAVDATVGFLYEPLNPDYKGEDPDDLVRTYKYTRQFAEDVCEEIDRILNEKED